MEGKVGEACNIMIPQIKPLLSGSVIEADILNEMMKNIWFSSKGGREEPSSATIYRRAKLRASGAFYQYWQPDMASCLYCRECPIGSFRIGLGTRLESHSLAIRIFLSILTFCCLGLIFMGQLTGFLPLRK